MLIQGNHPNNFPEKVSSEVQALALDLNELAGPLVERCSNLLSEIDRVDSCIKREHLPAVELRAFRSNVHAELKFLKAVSC